jgi:hydroxymethylglutaryl-CoA lyase
MARDRVVVNEVGLRDGIQSQPVLVTTAQKVELLRALLAAGVRHFEVTSFVSPKAVPQMADAAELAAQLPPQPRAEYTALVPNERGYARARDSGFASIATVTCTTESMNRRNTNMSLDDATTSAVAVIRRACADGVRARAYLATAAECPYEGPVPPDTVMRLADTMLSAGAHEVAVADTIGAANPAPMQQLLERLAGAFGADRLAVHFHDTRGMGVALAFAALQAGIRRFDASIGGLGGCPFAPGASGNLATEDLVFMLEGAGYDTGIDFVALAAAVDTVQRMVELPVGGRILRWHRSRTPGLPP